MKTFALALAAALALAFGVYDYASFGNRARAWLLAHPEVMEEAAQRLQAKAQAQEAADEQQAAAELPRLRAAIERDPNDFVANPNGRVTVTEFFDYRCPHCAHIAPQVLNLIRTRPEVRFVFKEMPIFGPTSEHAARAALAVKAAGGDYLGLYRRFMETRPLDDADIDAIAEKMGARPADLRSDPAADRHIAETTALFTRLRLGGTPTFIVGDDIIPGEDMDAIMADIAKQRGAASA
ncbi:MAG TPA: DsbA family protein [Caulobacteraceae bacterium]|nr:DsbA family protein [Caulobacteraceae bacterium]